MLDDNQIRIIKRKNIKKKNCSNFNKRLIRENNENKGG